jgi:hypothetical protein
MRDARSIWPGNLLSLISRGDSFRWIVPFRRVHSSREKGPLDGALTGGIAVRLPWQSSNERSGGVRMKAYGGLAWSLAVWL